MPKPISTIILSSLVAVLVAVGCGGDDSLTKAEFIQQSDEICRKAEVKKEAKLERFILSLDLSFGKFMTKKQREHQTKDIVMPSVRSMTDQISDLSPPEGEEAKVDALVASLYKAIEKSEKDSEKDLVPGAPFIDPFEKAAELARQFGFKTCFINY